MGTNIDFQVSTILQGNIFNKCYLAILSFTDVIDIIDQPYFINMQ